LITELGGGYFIGTLDGFNYIRLIHTFLHLLALALTVLMTQPQYHGSTTQEWCKLLVSRYTLLVINLPVLLT